MRASKVSLCRTALAAALACALPVRAGVVMDGSLGTAGALAGPNFAVGANLGRQLGRNLFHSFSSFGLTAAESATFSGPGSVANIIGRVTGGGLSSIDGRIASTIPGASFFFLNPAGIVFGPNATLDVGGSVHFSTGDHLYLSDGGIFSASTDPAASSLTTADPVAFGFLGRGAPIEINGSILRPGPGGTLAFSAGDITLAGANLGSEGGSVELSALGHIGLLESTIAVQGTGAPPRGIRIAGGEIVLVRSAVRSENDSSGDAGRVELDAGRGDLLMSNATVESFSLGSGSSGDLRLRAGNIELADGSGVASNAGLFGRGGNLSLTADDTVLAYGHDGLGRGSEISSLTFGFADAGSVAVNARAIGLFEGARIFSASLGLMEGAGSGGYISLTADDVRVSGVGADGFSSRIATESQGPGAGGMIGIMTRDLTVASGGRISASTYDTWPGAGSGGSIFIEASGTLTVAGTHPATGRLSQIAANSYGTGPAGFLSLRAGNANVLDGGEISSSSWLIEPGAGDGGFLSLDVSGTLRVAGNGPDGSKSMIYANTAGPGAAGYINIGAGRIELAEGGQIMSSTFSTEPDAGSGGSISIVAGTLDISGRGYNGYRESSGIYSETGGPGWSGFIMLDLDRLEMRDGGAISNGSFGRMAGAGDGGFISIDVTGEALLSGAGTGINSNTYGPGDAGYLTFTAGALSLRDGGQISSTAFGSMAGAGGGGYLSFEVGNETSISGVGQTGFPSALVAETYGRGSAGSIVLKTGSLTLADGGAISSSSLNRDSGAGSGGDVTVEASGDIRITGVNASGGRVSGIFSDSSGPGAAGSITMSGRRIELSAGGYVSSSAYGAEQGGGGWGRIEVNAAESLSILGTHMRGEEVNRSGIFTNTEGTAFAGDIVIETPRLEVRDGGLIASSALGQMPGASGWGRIDILAGAVLLSGVGPDGNPTLISTQSQGPGRAGDITLFADTLELRDGASINSASYGQMAWAGDGGSVNIDAGRVVLSGRRPDGTPTGISAELTGSGLAGGINIRAADALILADGAEIVTSASQADGGNIALTVGRLLQLTDSRITTSVGSGFGNGGNIDIDPVFTVLNNSVILANAYGGNGGNIRIVTDHLVSSVDSRIEASSELGIDGSVEISSPNVDVGSGLTVLPSSYLDAALLLHDACAGRAGLGSSLVGAGNGGLPQGPGSLLASRYDRLLPDDTPPPGTARRTQGDSPAVLAFLCGRRS